MTSTQVEMLNSIRPGDLVAVLVPSGIGRHGQEWTIRQGRAVMRGPHGWVLNMGGQHGTPYVATAEVVVRVKRGAPRQGRGKDW